MKITAILWHSYVPVFLKVKESLGFDLAVYAARRLEEDPDSLARAERDLDDCDLVLLYRTRDLFWEELEKKLRTLGISKPIVCLGHDPSEWLLSTVDAETVVTAQSYLTLNGEGNVKNLLYYLAGKVLHAGYDYLLPAEMPWEGIFHPRASGYFQTVEEYLAWYRPGQGPFVGMLCSRMGWISGSLEVETAIIDALERKGLNVIPVFSYSVRDPDLGSKGMGELVEQWFLEGPVPVDAIVKLNPFFLGSNREDSSDTTAAQSGVALLERLGVPVFHPVVTAHMTIEDWEASDGLSADVGWGVAMPEFEGVIEPIMVGASDRGAENFERRAIADRCERLAGRVRKWISLRQKPARERRVAFILHNNPCTGSEASVGGAANLDALESVARILQGMRERGYAVDAPGSGRELIETIMARKALSEFRWTSVQDIVRSGGALALVDKEDYGRWFETLDGDVRKRMIAAWGRPPGEPVENMPAAMVYDGSIVVTGVRYGNAVVCAQPKRGCAGSRCDGQVCRILHDPDVPPTHQYLATYRYLEDGFGADVLVHVGTHGNLEFLPGKGVGLSGQCFPDIAIGTVPHLYIYNADNPPEGTMAKRRSYACLVDHMQTALTQGGLYGDLDEVDRLLGEYQNAKHDRARAHALEHLLIPAIRKAKLDREIGLDEIESLDEIVSATHDALGRIRNTQVQTGMHVFGETPMGDDRVDLIYSILRYGDEAGSVRRLVAAAAGLDLDRLLSEPGHFSEPHGLSHGALVEKIDASCRKLVAFYLDGGGDPSGIVHGDIAPYREKLEAVRERTLDIAARLERTREIDALLGGMDGRYVPAGPAGLITRGREDILPTGRNFYSLDPKRVPTRSAWGVGRALARSVIRKHLNDEGKLPGNIAYYWMCNDVMWADGEGMAMIMALLGVEPVWHTNGRLKGFTVTPLSKLGRPRIDVTIRVSGIMRDNFPECIEIVDEAMQTVAALDEPPEQNFPRKHALAAAGENAGPDAWRDATLRIFSSKPGTYNSGVSLAVYASAWKTEKDLADIFLYWNSYAYGKGVKGKEAGRQLVNNLGTVDMTFNKVISDEHDLLGCCGYFGTQGGMTAAARSISGHEVRAYYGDTRESGHVEVRTLADEVRRVARTRLFNPKWIDGMKKHGYKGAADMMKSIGRVYGWEASTRAVDDWIFDDIARTFVLDRAMKDFFRDNNPYALEEITRRLMEAEQRKLWNADPGVMRDLRNTYLEIEGWMEGMDGSGGTQGNAIDVLAAGDIRVLAEKMKAFHDHSYK